MKKINSIVFVLLILTFLMSACANSHNEKLKTIVRVSHGQPQGHPDHEGMLAFKKYIEEKLGDKYEVLVYSNGLLGDSKNTLELTQTGAIEFVVASASNLETFNKIYSIFSMPYIFDNEAAYHEFMDTSEFAEDIYNSTVSQGIKVVGWFDAGVRNFYGSKPFKKVEDIKGMKVRVQPSPTNVAMMKAFNAGAVPMSFGDVYTALQNKTIDAAENNELALNTVKHGEVAKYYSYNRHQMVPDFIVANVHFMDSLSKEDRKVFDDALKLAQEVEKKEWTKAVEEAKKTASEQMGVTFVDADVSSFKEKLLPLHEQVFSQNDKLKAIYNNINMINKKHKE